ncbi:MAG: UMP kinase, partial [Deltaproteobacteria bacterium]|nr:UMP kinase [Deltaproteobacteria bacterium]
RDPHRFPDATMFKELTYIEVLKQKIEVMDATAISLCMEQRLPIRVFNITTPGNLPLVARGEDIGTRVIGD